MLDYPEFRRKAENVCVKEDEKKRIAAEFAVFEERGWEKYVVLLTEILGRIASVKHVHPSGSYKDSYAIAKVVNPAGDISCRQEDGELFPSGLSFCSLAIWRPVEFWITGKIRKNDEIIRNAVDSPGLYVRRAEGKAERDRIETTVVSTVPVPDEDVKTAVKSHDDFTPEEKERMKKYLIITVRERQI